MSADHMNAWAEPFQLYPELMQCTISSAQLLINSSLHVYNEFQPKKIWFAITLIFFMSHCLKQVRAIFFQFSLSHSDCSLPLRLLSFFLCTFRQIYKNIHIGWDIHRRSKGYFRCYFIVNYIADRVVLCALFNVFQYAVCNFQISDETKLYWAFLALITFS